MVLVFTPFGADFTHFGLESGMLFDGMNVLVVSIPNKKER